MSLRLSIEVQYAVGTPGRRCAIGPRIFTAALEHFSNSANSYDSMADFYEATQAYPAAAECMKKAILLDPLHRYKERLDELTVKIKP